MNLSNTKRQHEENLKNEIKVMQSERMRLAVDLDRMQVRWGLLEKYSDELKYQIDLLETHLRRLKRNKQCFEEEES
jgi:hypothetical protein